MLALRGGLKSNAMDKANHLTAFCACSLVTPAQLISLVLAEMQFVHWGTLYMSPSRPSFFFFGKCGSLIVREYNQCLRALLWGA